MLCPTVLITKAKNTKNPKTIHKIANISSTNFQLVLSVVSKRKDTNLLVVFVGYNTVGYFKLGRINPVD